jgi:hypothetical protein
MTMMGKEGDRCMGVSYISGTSSPMRPITNIISFKGEIYFIYHIIQVIITYGEFCGVAKDIKGMFLTVLLSL